MLPVVYSEVIDQKSGQQVCFDALRSGQARLCHLYPEQRTVSCCQLALCFDDQAWEAVPPEFKQLETLAEWVCHGLYKQKIFEGIPEQWKSLAFFRAMLACEPSLATFESRIFVLGIERLGGDLIDLVLGIEPGFLKHIPERECSYERCVKAVSLQGSVLEHVPASLVDHALCVAAMKQAPCLQYVPAAMLSEELALLALAHLESEESVAGFRMDVDDIACIPKSLFTQSLCRRLLLDDVHCIVALPPEHLTKELCAEALEGKELMGFMLDEIFEHIPEYFREELRQAAKFTYHVQPGEFGR